MNVVRRLRARRRQRPAAVLIVLVALALALGIGLARRTPTTLIAAVPAGTPERHSLPAVVTGSTSWSLRDTLTTGPATIGPFSLGARPLVPVMGDWDGNGSKTPGTYEGGTLKLRNANSSGAADLSFAFGDPRGFPVAGDFNGDGFDDIAVFRNGLWQIRHLGLGALGDTSFTFGTGTWPSTVPVTGDWDGNGTDGIGTYTLNSGSWSLRNTASAGAADLGPFTFWSGSSSSYPVAGDWDADKTDSVGYRSGTTWSLTNTPGGGAVAITFDYGSANDLPLVWKKAGPTLQGLEASALAYTTGSPAQALTSNLTVVDPDSPTLAGATVTIGAGYDNGQDVLSLPSQPAISGSFAAASGTLTLSGTASLADYQAALRSVTFGSGSSNSATRAISFQIDDGAALDNLSNTASRDIAVTVAAPTAVAQSYSGAIGNTIFGVGTSPAQPSASTTGSVLDGGSNGGAGTLSAVTSGNPIATTQGGSATMNANGTFTYLPPPGFTGSDTFTFTVTNGSKTASNTATIAVANRVWYVDNSAPAGDGRSTSPFNTLASLRGAGDADGPGDVLFLETGSGAYAGGLALEDNQRLVGQPESLVVGAATLWTGAGANPTITNTTPGGAGITLAQGNTIRRVHVSGTSGAGITGSGITTADIGPNLSVTNAGGGAFQLSGNANGAITMAGTITHSASGARAVSIANRQGGTVALSGPITDTAGGISLATNTGATINVTGGISVSSGANPAFSATGGGTVNATGTNTLTTSTATALNVANTTIGTSGLNVRSINSNGGATGIVLNTTGSTGGLTVSGTGTAGTGGTIQNKSGAGISLTNVGGVVSLASMATSNVAGTDVLLSGGGANVTYSGAITNQAGKGRSVEVSGRTGGTALFSGAINDDATGVNLASNPGATVTFSGGVDLNTGTSDAFSATGDGTVNVTGPNNVIITTSGTALNVANTNIGGSNLTFRSINSNGGARGILLSNTGSSGGLVVTGTGTAGSGGIIQNKSLDGVRLDATRNTSLSWMNINSVASTGGATCTTQNATDCNAAIDMINATNVTLNRVSTNGSGQTGISGSGVNGLTMTNTVVNNAGNAPLEMGVLLVNPAGTVLVQDSTIDNPESSALRLYKNSGSPLNMTLRRVTLRNNDPTNGEDGFQLEVEGTGSANILVDDSDFLNIDRQGIDGLVEQTNGAVLNLTVQNSTFDNNAGLPSAVSFVTGGSATGRLKLDNNNMTDGGSTAMNVVSILNSTLHAVIEDNVATVPGLGVGLRMQAEDDSTIRARVNDNTVTVNSTIGMEISTTPLSNGDTASLDLTVEGNTINGIADLFLPGILMEMGQGGSLTSVATSMCVNLATAQGAGGNTVNGTPGPDVYAYSLRQRAGTAYKLQGFTGSGTSAAAVEAFVQTNNPAGTLGGKTIAFPAGGSTVINYTSGTCTVPTSPTLP